MKLHWKLEDIFCYLNVEVSPLNFPPLQQQMEIERISSPLYHKRFFR